MIVLSRGVVAGAVFLGTVSLGSVAQGMNVGDINQEWTVDGKKLAAERIKLPAYDEMVRIPAGPNDQKPFDRLRA